MIDKYIKNEIQKSISTKKSILGDRKILDNIKEATMLSIDAYSREGKILILRLE